jgi:hypothetical protein
MTSHAMIRCSVVRHGQKGDQRPGTPRSPLPATSIVVPPLLCSSSAQSTQAVLTIPSPWQQVLAK